VFSDYYHKNPNGEYREDREPAQEFGMSFFAEDFPEKEWNLYLNLMADCTKNWLLHGKIEAAEANVLRNIYRNQMGPNFEPWADVFFNAENGNLDTFVQRTMAYEEYKRKYSPKVTPQGFMDRLGAWCKYNEYVLNPVEVRRPGEKRITKWVIKQEYVNNEWRDSGKKESVEMIYIMTDKAKLKLDASDRPADTTKKPVQQDLFIEPKSNTDDMPF